MGLYDTHLTTSELHREENDGSRTPTYKSEPENDQTFQWIWDELRSKALHDPARLPVTPIPSPPPAQTTEQASPVPSIQAPPTRSMNKLKAAVSRTILEEKRLSTNMIVDRKLVLKGKKKANSFVTTDHVVVRGKMVKCSILDINEELGRIEAEYNKDEDEWKRAAPVDTSPSIDVDILQADTTPSTQAGEPSVMPSIFEIPPTTATGDVVLVDDDDESDTSETEKKDLGTRDATVYDDLEDLEGATVQTMMEASLQDTSMIGSSGAQSTSEDESGIDAQTERTPDMQCSPQV
uniref:Polyprotein protein n=1 Tax=Solanum tuberosum TaxID=4113 RepID=M1DQ33_SOLTU